MHKNLIIKEPTDNLYSRAFESGSLPALIYLSDSGQIIEVNTAARLLFDLTSEKVRKTRCPDLFSEQPHVFRKIKRQILATGKSTIEGKYKNNKGEIFNCTLNAASFLGDDGSQYVKLTLVPVWFAPSEPHEQPSKDQFLSQSEWVKFIATSSYDVMWDWDIQNGNIYIGESIYKVLGFRIKNNSLPFRVFTKHIVPEDKLRVQQMLDISLQSKQLYWKDRFSLIKSDGVIASTMARGNIVRDDTGNAIRMIGALQDLSKLQELEKKLKQQSTTQKKSSETHKEEQLVLEKRLAEEISSKEKAIASAVVDAQELQRSELGRELHDNVNQLLGASKLYLDMARTEEGDISIYLNRSQEYTTTAIEAIRSLSKDLTATILSEFGLSEAIDKLVTDTMETLPLRIYYFIEEQGEASLSLSFKLNIYRIIQEQLNNIIKYANANEVNIQLSKSKFAVILSITDDGIGFNVQQHQAGIGLSNIKSRSTLFNGAVTILSKPGAGCTIKILFPASDVLFGK